MPSIIRSIAPLLAAATLASLVPPVRAAERAAAPLSAVERAAIEKAVLETHDRIMQAAQELKADENLSFMLDTDRGALITNGRILLTRAQATESIRAAYAGLKSQKVRVIQRHVSVLSPTVVLVVAEAEGTATTLDGRELTGRSAQTVVFILSDGAWKVAHAHQSSAR
jgi:hypothetical protein